MGVPGRSWDKQRTVGLARAGLRLPGPASHGSGTSLSGAELTLIPRAAERVIFGSAGPDPGAAGR